MAAKQLYTAIPLLDESEATPTAVKTLGSGIKKTVGFVSISQLADRYGCHRHTIRNRILRILAEKTIVGYKIGDRMIPPNLLSVFVDWYGEP
ncbi:MAG: Lrp/AsnC family transcriptional regulator [Spirosomataceae bacterium]|mgnify:CR=1 FL=1